MISSSSLDKGDSLYQELAAVVGQENVHIAGEFYDACTHDAAEIIRLPLAAVSVISAQQVPATLRLARKYSLPIIARGAGTGYTGGAIAERGGIVLSFAKMDRILEIDKARRVAIVEPGVTTQQLAGAAEAQGLFYPPDPASLKDSTIGGNVAECAGGLRCKKYGLTKDYVLGIEGYDADGDQIQTGYFASEQTYDLTSVLIGSEGTLMLITKIAAKLIELPKVRRAGGDARLLPRDPEDGEQDRGEDGDDGDHHQQLNEREAPAAPAHRGATTVGHVGSTPFRLRVGNANAGAPHGKRAPACTGDSPLSKRGRRRHFYLHPVPVGHSFTP